MWRGMIITTKRGRRIGRRPVCCGLVWPCSVRRHGRTCGFYRNPVGFVATITSHIHDSYECPSSWTDEIGGSREAPSLIAQGFDGCPPKAHTGSSELQGRLLLGLLHHPTGRLKQECSHYTFRLIFTAHDNWSMLENSLSRPCAFPSEP